MLEFLVHKNKNIKGKSDEVLPLPTTFLVTIKCLKFFILNNVIRGLIKQLSELGVFWRSVKKAFDLSPAICPEICI